MTKIKADAQAQLGQATRHLVSELADARAERDRLRTRMEALEAIVTDEGFDLARDARRAGLEPPLHLDDLLEARSEDHASMRTRFARTR